MIVLKEKSARVATQIVSAVHEHDANYALEQIYKALSESGSASLLVRIVDCVHQLHLPKILSS